MNAQHTPNWELETHYNHKDEPHLEVYGRPGAHLRKPIARLYPDCSFADDTDKANARLIAAAPDLLEALRAVWQNFSERKWYEKCPEVHAMMIAAITKAEGE